MAARILAWVKLPKICYRPFLLFWKACKWVTRKSPLQLAPWLIWILIAANAYKPLFGNPFSIEGWKNAFREPAGFIVYIAVVIITLILSVSALRAGVLINLSVASQRLFFTRAYCSSGFKLHCTFPVIFYGRLLLKAG